MNAPSLHLTLPAWWPDPSLAADRPRPTLEERVRFVNTLARRNLEHATGGPFGAAVFDRRTGELVAPGMNLVVSAGCSILHAEVVALIGAQRVLGTWDLGGDDRDLELVCSTEPCAMCFGAVLWSGVRSLVCSADGADARAIGFDEGPKVDHWPEELERRGIAVRRDVLRDEGAAVLRDYAAAGGVIYNGGGTPVGETDER